jgi:L-lactate dehydrogenase complex protein LldG
MTTPPPDSRERILARIREALQVPAPKRHLGRHQPPAPPAANGSQSPRAWLPPVPESFEGRLALFAKNSAELRTEFIVCANAAELAAGLRRLAAESGWTRVAAHRFPRASEALGLLDQEILWIDQGFQTADLESAGAGISGCECLVAQTGSILISAKSAGGRALSVLPPHHVVIATRGQLVGDLADALAHARASNGGEAPAFLSFITGPSRTGDIERTLVLGAHGPKRLTVFLLNA